MLVFLGSTENGSKKLSKYSSDDRYSFGLLKILFYNIETGV